MQCRDIILEMAEERKDQRHTLAESENDISRSENEANSLAQDVQKKLLISSENVDHQKVEPPPPSSTIICDAWYGLPTQKRPRRERVNAIARQLRNFEQSELLSSSVSARRRQQQRTSAPAFRVVLVGKQADVQVIGERLEKLREDERKAGKEGGDNRGMCKVELLPDVSVEEACGKVVDESDSAAAATTSKVNQAIYLSPDAETTLDPRKSPPRTVVVGMLIDRRVQPNRSNQRAAKIDVVKAARLPMDELAVEGLETNEALNVDTVLEMMVCWWDAVDKEQLKDIDVEDDRAGEMLRCSFLEAASAAMVSHEDRHPNRAIHGTGN